MFKTLRNAWKVEEIRKKILFTLLIVLIYRIGNAVPVPYINVDTLKEYFNTLSNTVLGLYNVMSGGAFSSATVFALSIQPYINASIIIQLLCVAIPTLRDCPRMKEKKAKRRSLPSQDIPQSPSACFRVSATMYFSGTTACSQPKAAQHGRRSSLSQHLRQVPLSLCGWANRSLSSVSETVFPSSCL
jgi:hypothetical protein